ncbi:MAG: signal recognition particle-docking protein FtsY [Chlamydiales bacterium]|nr:signal recognition particle-docking protein FtsY [Chlamydiales bacterium]
MLKFLKSGFEKVKSALTKTRSLLSRRIQALFGKPWDDSTFEELEQILFESDLGIECANRFVERLRKDLRTKPNLAIEEILQLLESYALELLQQTPPHPLVDKKPRVILIVGVNGSGKTTSIAKLARHFQLKGEKVMLAAADTFRAAAIDQLALWAEKLGIEIVKSQPGADPAAVAFDALESAKARKIDLLLIDTAGRLQNKTDLMQELEKMRKTCHKVLPGAPHETLLVLDATTGQNALDQAETFHRFTPLTGLILAKLDGSAKGGIILSIHHKLQIPVRWIGTGETAEDLEPFDPPTYVKALFSTD